MNYDAVLGYHLNPLTCGVARFNAQLAEKLGVPHDSIGAAGYRHPLVSVKWGELQGQPMAMWPTFDLLWHDAGEATLSRRASRVWYARDTGCPSLVRGDASRGAINVLTFGFAHKFQGVHFETLKKWLDRHGEPYTISLSTGIHEGNPWDVGFRENVELMRGIFGDHLRVLGFLGDDALAKELQDCTAVALFYEPAVRANNTTFWAALEAGCLTIANADYQSPDGLEHGVNFFNARHVDRWPSGEMLTRFSRARAQAVAQVYGWDRILGVLA